MSKAHKLKCWPEFFGLMQTGFKPFEIRRDDRNFEAGDTLVLEEFDPCRKCEATGKIVGEFDMDIVCPECVGTKGVHTGNVLERNVKYVLQKHPGLAPGYICMAVSKV